MCIMCGLKQPADPDGTHGLDGKYEEARYKTAFHGSYFGDKQVFIAIPIEVVHFSFVHKLVRWMYEDVFLQMDILYIDFTDEEIEEYTLIMLARWDGMRFEY